MDCPSEDVVVESIDGLGRGIVLPLSLLVLRCCLVRLRREEVGRRGCRMSLLPCACEGEGGRSDNSVGTDMAQDFQREIGR